MNSLKAVVNTVMDDLRMAVDAVMGGMELAEDAMDEDGGFDVTESYELGSRGDVKEDRQALPAAKRVLARVEKASIRLTRMTEKGNAQSGSVKAVNLQVRYPEGLAVDSGDGSEPTMKYANKVDFIELEYQVAKPELRMEERYTGKNRSFLIPLTRFLTAIGIPPEQTVTINDDFLAELAGKTFYVDIGRKPVSLLDEETGKWTTLADRFDTEGKLVERGVYKNRYSNFQSA